MTANMKENSVRRSLASLSPKAKRSLSVFGTALVVATGAFWATMLTDPPKTEASNPGFSVSELQRNAPLNLPIGVADAR